MITKTNKNKARKRRHTRVRRQIIGTTERPRLNVFRSSKHIYAQLIDDMQGKTLVSASTLEKDIAGNIEHGGNVQAAEKVGEAIAKRAVDGGYRRVVFDRGGYLYHGRIKALAEKAREEGLEF